MPQCSDKTYILGSPLPAKDLVIGFDVYFKSKFRILPRGIQYKTHFLPYTLTLSLYEIQPFSTNHIALIKAQKSNTHVQTLIKNFLLNVLIHCGKIHSFLSSFLSSLMRTLIPRKSVTPGRILRTRC